MMLSLATAKRVDEILTPELPGAGRIAATATILALTTALGPGAHELLYALFALTGGTLGVIAIMWATDRQPRSGTVPARDDRMPWQTGLALSLVVCQIAVVVLVGTGDGPPTVLNTATAGLLAGWNLLVVGVRRTLLKDPNPLLRRKVRRVLESADAGQGRMFDLLQVHRACCDAVNGRRGRDWWEKGAKGCEGVRWVVRDECARRQAGPGADGGLRLIADIWAATEDQGWLECCKAHRLQVLRGDVRLYRKLSQLDNAHLAFRLLHGDMALPYGSLPQRSGVFVRNLLRRIPEWLLDPYGRVASLLETHRWDDASMPDRPRSRQATARLQTVDGLLAGRRMLILDALLAGWQQDVDTLSEAVRAL